jgi:hypothetical protein
MSKSIIDDSETEFQLSADQLFADYVATKKRSRDIEARALRLSTRGDHLDQACEDTLAKIQALKDILKPKLPPYRRQPFGAHKKSPPPAAKEGGGGDDAVPATKKAKFTPA